MSYRRVARTVEDIPAKVRAAVHERDGERCRICGRHGEQIHHIRYRSQGGPHELWNLLLVCEPCHRLAHSDKPRFQELLLEVASRTGVTFFELERRRKRMA